MTKHRRKIGVLLTVILMSIIWMVPSIMVNAAPSSSKKTNPPEDCTKANLKSLTNYYHIGYDWDKKGTSIEFKVENGEFRFIRIDTKYFTNSFSVDENGFYTIDGKQGKITKDHKVKLTVNDNHRGESAVVRLALVSKSGGCDSWTTFKAKQAANQTTATFESGEFEVVIPFKSGDQTKLKEDNSALYNGVCKALRNGQNHNNKINAEVLKLYDGSEQAKTYYKNMAPECFEEKTLYIFPEGKMIDIIETILSTWPTYSVLTTSGIGFDPSNDVSGQPWLFTNDRFDQIRREAKEAGHDYYTDGNRNFYDKKDGKLVKDKNGVLDMKCRVDANSPTDYSNLLRYKSDGTYNIDANVQSYYAYNVEQQSLTYKWYTGWKGTANPEPKETTVKEFCKRTCEEAVEVKYGPPVATKAGVCFEYQVQVTSRVRCSTEVNETPPEHKPMCVPVPYCNDIPGHVHQAGANDEYKACIRSCDGGKYTKACNEKCYKKVYEKNSKTSKTSKANNDTKTAQSKKLYSTAFSYSGHHYFSGDSIRWSGNGYANYYKYYEPGRTAGDHGRYVPESGFKKRLYDNGETCKDPCFFSGCEASSDYVNKADFIKDYANNVENYKSAINKCKASASCTTKTATFTIKVDYKNRKGSIKTVNYPYTEGSFAPEELISDDNDTNCAPNSSTTALINNIILKHAGCYEHCGKGLQYHTRWSFPGDWLIKKTGEHSFKPQKEEDGWERQTNKFCLPLDVQDVNSKWWKYYYGLYDNNHTTSYDSTAVGAKCVSPTTVTTVTESDIENWNVEGTYRWNINASTRNFGYYGWNFDIACFYALNSKSTKVTEETKSNEEKCNPNNPSEETYRIRTVDLSNLFPAPNGQSGSRQPGFNWSTYATTEAVNGKNQSVPSAYAEEVQKTGINVYSDQYLDYYFELSREALQKIKAGSRDRNYADYKGGMVTQHGMHSYKSSFIRSDEISSTNNKVLKEKAIGCNNVDNYDSENCNNVHKVGE